jgi:hypothetical protein
VKRGREAGIRRHGARAAGPAAAVLLALTCASCGHAKSHAATAERGRQSAAPTGITFKLKAGASQSLVGCGGTHNYRLYAVGSTVRFAGTVSPIPRGRWKIKVKLKRCQAGAFTRLTEIVATKNKRAGTFQGQFPAPPAGLYSARASLSVDGKTVGKSRKRHFKIS